MASAGGSGAGEGRKQSSRDKNKSPVSAAEKPKKLGAVERAMIRFVEAYHVKCVAAGEEPPFGGRYAPSTTNPVVTRPSSDSGAAKNQSEHETFPPKDC